jgi:hypothetical protein
MAKEILILGEITEDMYDLMFFKQITPVVFDGVVRVRDPISELPDLATEIMTQPMLDAITAGAVLWDHLTVNVAGGTPVPVAVETIKRKWARWAQRVESDWADRWAHTGTWVNV